MKLSKATAIYIIALVCLSYANIANSALISNGSLTGNVGIGTTPSGWTINSFSPDTLSATSQPFGIDVNPGDSPDGGTWVGLARNSNVFESFGQDVSGFTIGQTYSISWYNTNTACCSGTFSAAAEILFDLDGATVFAGSTIAADGMWYQETYNFVATALTHTLDFRLDVGTEAYLGIDGIALSLVSDVPAPTSSVFAIFMICSLLVLKAKKWVK